MLDPLVTPSPSSSQPYSSPEYKNPILGQAAQVQHRDRRRVQKIESEIAIARNIHRVARDRGESQVARDGFAIERKPGAGQRAAAERHHVDARASFRRAARNRARTFRNTRADNAATAPAARGGYACSRGRSRADRGGPSRSARTSGPSRAARRVDLVAQPQPNIERNLIVAAAPGVDLVRELARAFLQLADDQRVDVFVVCAIEKRRRTALPRASLRTPRRLCALRPRSECRRVPAPAHTPATRECRHRSGAGRNAASPKIARKLPTALLESPAPQFHTVSLANS